jgi:hypothetical protein
LFVDSTATPKTYGRCIDWNYRRFIRGRRDTFCLSPVTPDLPAPHRE